MSFLASWFVDRTTILPFVSDGDEGGDVYGPARVARCRVERFEGIVRSSSGEERDVEYRIAYPLEDAPGLRDRVLLEDDVETSTDAGRVPVQIKRARRRNGTGGLAEVFL